MAVHRLMKTKDGEILLDLLEKSVLTYALPPTSDARALTALDAQRHIPLDFERLKYDELRSRIDAAKDILARGRDGNGGNPR